MSDRVRTALAFLLIIVILLIWNLLSKSKKSTEQAQPDHLDTAVIASPPEVKDLPVSAVIPEYADTIIIDGPQIRVVLSTAGASVKEFYLKKYDVDLVPEGEYLFVSKLNNNEIPVYNSDITGDSVVFEYAHEGNICRKIYYFDNPYGFRLRSDMPNITDQILSLKAGLRVTEEKNRGEDLRHFNIYVMNEKVEQLKKKVKDELKYTGAVDWLALRTKYFALVINDLNTINTIRFYKLQKDFPQATAYVEEKHIDIHSAAFGCFYMRGGGDRYGAEIIGAQTIDIDVLLLPIKYSELAKFEKSYEQMASGGIMGPISRIILWIFNLLYSMFSNYGFAIVIFAVLVKAVFFPLSRKMILSQQKMQMIQPELKKIQKKYKEDPQRLNQEMMQLYKTYKVNPLGGCLPLLIQMPIFFALYQTLIASIEFRQAPFIFWLTDLSIKDPSYILPISMGVIMLVQSLMTTLDPRQKFMVIIMPIFMVFIFLNFPSGLQLYWFSFNILTLLEHIITKRGGIK